MKTSFGDQVLFDVHHVFCFDICADLNKQIKADVSTTGYIYTTRELYDPLEEQLNHLRFM